MAKKFTSIQTESTITCLTELINKKLYSLTIFTDYITNKTDTQIDLIKANFTQQISQACRTMLSTDVATGNWETVIERLDAGYRVWNKYNTGYTMDIPTIYSNITINASINATTGILEINSITFGTAET